MSNENDRPTSWLDKVQSEAVYQDESSPTPAVKTPTVILEDNISVPKRVPNFVINFADIPLSAAKHGD